MIVLINKLKRLLTNGVGHGCILFQSEYCKRNLIQFNSAGACHLAATTHTVKRYMQGMHKTTNTL